MNPLAYALYRSRLLMADTKENRHRPSSYYWNLEGVEAAIKKDQSWSLLNSDQIDARVLDIMAGNPA